MPKKKSVATESVEETVEKKSVLPEIKSEETSVETNQIVENHVKEEVVEETKPLLDKEQRAVVYKYILNGYQIKDILRKARVFFQLSDEIYDKLSKDVHTVEDLINNIGIPYIPWRKGN